MRINKLSASGVKLNENASTRVLSIPHKCSLQYYFQIIRDIFTKLSNKAKLINFHVKFATHVSM